MCESYHCEKASIELVKIGFLQHSEIYVFLSNSDESNTILTNIERTQTSFFETSNELECVYLLMIELEHLNFGIEFKRPSLDLLNYSSKKLEDHFFEH